MSAFVSKLGALRTFLLRVRDGSADRAISCTHSDPNGALQAIDSVLRAQTQIDRIDELLLRHAQNRLPHQEDPEGAN